MTEKKITIKEIIVEGEPVMNFESEGFTRFELLGILNFYSAKVEDSMMEEGESNKFPPLPIAKASEKLHPDWHV